MGSPIMPVKSPITKMTRWPRSWKCFIFRMSTVWPEVEVGRGGVEADLDRERLAPRELGAQGLRGDHVHAALGEVGEVAVDAHATSHDHAAPFDAVAPLEHARTARG